MASPRFQFTLYDYLRIFFQRWAYWSVPLLAASLVAAILAYTKEEVYETKTRSTVVSWKEESFVGGVGAPELAVQRLYKVVDSFKNANMLLEIVLRLTTPIDGEADRLIPLTRKDGDQTSQTIEDVGVVVEWFTPTDIPDIEKDNLKPIEQFLEGDKQSNGKKDKENNVAEHNKKNRKLKGIYKGEEAQYGRIIEANIQVNRDRKTGEIITGQTGVPNFKIRIANQWVPADEKVIAKKFAKDPAMKKEAYKQLDEVNKWMSILSQSLNINFFSGKYLQVALTVNNKDILDDIKRTRWMPIIANTVRDMVENRYYELQNLENDRARIVLANEIYKKQKEVAHLEDAVAQAKIKFESKYDDIEFPFEDATQKNSAVPVDQRTIPMRNTEYYFARLEEILPKYKDLTNDVSRLKDQIAELKEEINNNDSSEIIMKSDQETIEWTTEGTRLKNRKAFLKSKIADLQIICTPEHPLLKKYTAELFKVEKILEDSDLRIVKQEIKKREKNPLEEKKILLSNKEDVLSEKISKMKSLHDEIKNIQDLLSKVPALERVFVERQKELARKKATLDHMKTRYEEAMIDKSVKENKFTKFQLQVAANRPMMVYPQKSYIIAIGLIIGVLCSGLLVFFVEYLDHSIVGVSEAKRYLDFPVLGAIPDFNLISQEESRRSPDKWLKWRGRKAPEEFSESIDVI